MVDTNVLLYAANVSSPFHPACRTALESWRRGRTPWYATWAILYEFLRVTTHPRVLSPAWSVGQAWSFVDSLLASPGFGVLVATSRHAAVAAQAMREVPQLSGNLLHDAHTAILMREHGIRRVLTRDTDFHRFPWVEVVDPAAVPPER
ncbi:MAG: type II toxin-antitoxin system VapC family toxin [Deltaproteobacteria bacterium]